MIRNFLQNITLKIKEILPFASVQEHSLSMTAWMKNYGISRKMLDIQMKGSNASGLEDKPITFPFYLLLLQGMTFCIIELSSSDCWSVYWQIYMDLSFKNS